MRTQEGLRDELARNEVAAQLDPEGNNGLLASKIVFGSNAKVWWRCPS
ncbi:zinc-ribbon domain-containing protein [Paractinoplanes deccanensis]